ncbi:membrane protein [Gordonia phage Button]|nr:membrane protein [Gordonia phage Button]
MTCGDEANMQDEVTVCNVMFVMPVPIAGVVVMSGCVFPHNRGGLTCSFMWRVAHCSTLAGGVTVCRMKTEGWMA